ncbi:MAG: M6 family metalloprotease domain-containing protein, partial [Candidatus Hodarchaeota archaeon]
MKKMLILLLLCLSSLIPYISSMLTTANLQTDNLVSEELEIVADSPKMTNESIKYLRPAENLKEGQIQPPGVRPAPYNKQKLSTSLGTHKVLVLLVDFSDQVGVKNKTYFEDLIFTDNPGSTAHYYATTSRGQVAIDGEVAGSGWYRASNTLSWYGEDNVTEGDDQKNGEIYELAEELILLADADVDFSEYDTDSDNHIDHLMIVFAGSGQESSSVSSDIWSHSWAVPGGVSVDGINVTSYTMQSENSPMGVFAHEFGHDLGLPDLYDTDYSSDGIGDWGMMAGGSWNGGGAHPAHFCAWSQIQLGWITPTNLTVGGTYTLHSFNDTGEVYKIAINDPNEYFLLAYRQKEGYYDHYLPGSGLLIWHIDDLKLEVEYPESPNDDENHKLVDLEEADGGEDLDVYDADEGSATDPFNGINAEFSFNTTPNSNDYADLPSGIKVSSVKNTTRRQSSATIEFTADLNSWPYSGNSSEGAFQLRDGKTYSFQLDGSNSFWFALNPTSPRQGLNVSFILQYSNLSSNDVIVDILSPDNQTVIDSYTPSGDPFIFNYTFLTG